MTNTFAALRLLPMNDHDRAAEIPIFRPQINVLERQLGDRRIRSRPADRAWLAALLDLLPRGCCVRSG